jgi:DMSO/TMAO reductase YedYZ heme-binding membrane subunit
MRRLGKRWTRLHRLVYLAGILVIVHYSWAVKSDIRVPLIYGAAVLLLLVARIPSVRRSISAFRHGGPSSIVTRIREGTWSRRKERAATLTDVEEKAA